MVHSAHGSRTSSLRPHLEDVRRRGDPPLLRGNIAALHAELHAKDYSFMNPGLEPHGAALEMVLLDPASNELRFYQPGRSSRPE